MPKSAHQLRGAEFFLPDNPKQADYLVAYLVVYLIAGYGFFESGTGRFQHEFNE